MIIDGKNTIVHQALKAVRLWEASLLLCCIAFSGSLNAQIDEERNIIQNPVFYGKMNVRDFFHDTSDWAWEADLVYRRQAGFESSNVFSNPLRLSIRPWISYNVTNLTRVSVSPLGIFHTAPRTPRAEDVRPGSEGYQRELRSTLQINKHAYFKRFNFTHRMRFESRWRDIDNPAGSTQNFRFRYRIRLRTPLNTDYFYKNNTLYMSNYHEVHIQFGSDYGLNYFSQSRNYIGFGFRFWDWTRIELGYLHQYQVRSNVYEIDLLQGPMMYLYFDIVSKNKKNYNFLSF